MNVCDGKYAGPLTADQVITQFEYRIGIHESYAGLVLDDPARWIQFGSYEFHMWAINGYREGIRHMTGDTVPEVRKSLLQTIIDFINSIGR